METDIKIDNVKVETFEADGRVIENKPIFMVEIFWDGDTNNRGFGNWFILDEDNKTGLDVYMSMYSTKEEAENGYHRWEDNLKKHCVDTVVLYGELVRTGIGAKYPSVIKEFIDCSGFQNDWEMMVEHDNYTELLPKAHKIVETNTKNMNEAFHGFYGPRYADKKIVKVSWWKRMTDSIKHFFSFG